MFAQKDIPQLIRVNDIREVLPRSQRTSRHTRKGKTKVRKEIAITTLK